MSDVFDQISEGLACYFEDNWTKTDIAWPNIEFTDDGVTEYVRFNFLPNLSQRATMTGSPNKGIRMIGVLTINIFTEKHLGEEVGVGYATEIVALFQEKRIGTATSNFIITRVPTPTNVGSSDDRWHQINVTVPVEQTT